MMTRGMIEERWGGSESPTAMMLREEEEDNWDDDLPEEGMRSETPSSQVVVDAEDGRMSPSLLMEEGMVAMFGTTAEDKDQEMVRVEAPPRADCCSPSLEQDWDSEEEEGRKGSGATFTPISLGDAGAVQALELAEQQMQHQQPEVVMYKCEANVQRASRTARPCEPLESVRAECWHAMAVLKAALDANGYTRVVPKEAVNMRALRNASSSSNGKGPGVKTEESDQAKMNHMISIKSKTMDQNNGDPYYLMNGRSAPPKYDRLAKLAIKTNAVQSSVTDRAKTQAAANQTSRINYVPIGQAAASQLVNCELTMALARGSIRHRRHVVNPIATNEVNAPSLVLRDWKDADYDVPFVTTTTTQLLYNVCPTKLGDGSVIGVAKMLAKREIEDQYISETMGYASTMLTCICEAIVAPGEYDQDAVWSSWFLVVYMMSDPRGRRLLSSVPLTDLDYHVAVAFEAYGRAELTRRARLRRQQQSAAEAKRAKKAKVDAASVASAAALAEHVQADTGEPSQSSGATADLATSTMDEDQKRQADADDLLVELQDKLDIQQSPGSSEPAVETSKVEAAAAAMEASDDKVIATKRRRSGKGQASASSSDATGLLEWWFRALRNPDKSVLLTLVAYCRSAARDAAGETLGRQVGDNVNVASNEVIQDIAQRAAVKSAEALAPFVGRKTHEVPCIKGVLVKHPKVNGVRLCAGFVRIKEQERNTLLLCCKVKKQTHAKDCNLVVAWSEHSRKLKPDLNERGESCPNVLERMRYMSDLKYGNAGEVLSDAKRSQQYELHKTWVASEAAPPMPTAVSGITRSIVSLVVRMPVCKQQRCAAKKMLDEWVQLDRQYTAMDSDLRRSNLGCVPSEATCVNRSQQGDRMEPYCSGNSQLVLGVGLNEAKRVWLHGKTRKNDQCKWSAMLHTDQELPKEYPSIDDTEPSPMLTMTDLSLEAIGLENEEEEFGDNKRFEHDKFCASLHVCGDGAIRLPEAIALLHSEVDAMEILSLVWTGISQSSYVADVGSCICAGYANTAIASSKKMSVADNNKVYNLTVFDCYVAGLMNLHPDFVNTSWSGMYGCRVDHGLSPPGLMAHNYRSDKRQHGNMMLRQEPANQLCVEFAKRRWIYDKESKTYDAMPAQTMGIAHNFTPGVHQNLEYYQKATEKLRSKLGREGCDTQDSVMVLPCSVFSQGLPPDIEATADHSTRLCVRDKEQLSTIAGKAYLPDATEFDKALLKEPLWRRPCQASIQDNPFATSYEHGSSFFGAASGLGMLALVVGGVERLGKIMWMWHNEMSDADATPATMLYAVSGLMMLSTMYPVTWNIGEEVIPPSYAEMMPAVFRKYAQEGCRKPSQMCMPGLGFSEEMMQDARSFCDAMFKDTLGMKASRLTTWDTAVAPLLEEIVKWKGSHDMSVEQHKRMSEVLDNAARAAWIQHSPDGVTPPAAPCPAGEVSEWTRVRRPQLDPVFVGDEKTGASARGCLVGLKPHQLRQVCALAVGAHLPNVKCQVVRNEGGLSLRISSAADMLDEKGKLRSLKSISPVQTEGECDGYGSRKDKENAAPLQRNAWDKNALLLAPLFVAIGKPLPVSIRGRAAMGRPNAEQATANQQMAVSMQVKHNYDALCKFLDACQTDWNLETDALLQPSVHRN